MAATDTQAPPAEKKPVLTGWWSRLWRPARTTALGVLLIAGFVGGILFWGGFHWALELTNTEEFCISCHEMRSNAFAEYRSTAHYINGSGVRASCPDCHVPKEWAHKIIRKVQATNELYHHVLGSVSTPERFNDKRLQLAVAEWTRMKTTDSRECRNCHKFEFMDYAAQEPRAAKTHHEALTAGKTCIDCHRGIAHKLPPRSNEVYQKLVESLASGDSKGLSDYLKGLTAATNAAPTR